MFFQNNVETFHTHGKESERLTSENKTMPTLTPQHTTTENVKQSGTTYDIDEIPRDTLTTKRDIYESASTLNPNHDINGKPPETTTDEITTRPTPTHQFEESSTTKSNTIITTKGYTEKIITDDLSEKSTVTSPTSITTTISLRETTKNTDEDIIIDREHTERIKESTVNINEADRINETTDRIMETTNKIGETTNKIGETTDRLTTEKVLETTVKDEETIDNIHETTDSIKQTSETTNEITYDITKATVNSNEILHVSEATADSDKQTTDLIEITTAKTNEKVIDSSTEPSDDVYEIFNNTPTENTEDLHHITSSSTETSVHTTNNLLHTTESLVHTTSSHATETLTHTTETSHSKEPEDLFGILSTIPTENFEGSSSARNAETTSEIMKNPDDHSEELVTSSTATSDHFSEDFDKITDTVSESFDSFSKSFDTVSKSFDTVSESFDTVSGSFGTVSESFDNVSETATDSLQDETSHATTNKLDMTSDMYIESSFSDAKTEGEIQFHYSSTSKDSNGNGRFVAEEHISEIDDELGDESSGYPWLSTTDSYEFDDHNVKVCVKKLSILLLYNQIII